ncbi:hypothetical protein [Helicobacter felis]|uniref:hypothetical protein n=1 Tax=Helicobacter felis TaxID=214 RepID=UPI000CF078A2|nr:hypothetical protein [Helicobacter felis]
MGIFDLVRGFMGGAQANQDTPQTITIDEEIARHVKGSGDSKASDFGYSSWIAYYKKNTLPQKR